MSSLSGKRKLGNGNKRRKWGRTLGHQMPPRRIQRLVRAPGDIRAVRSTRTVLVDIRRAKRGLPVQSGIRAHIAPPPVSREVIRFAHNTTACQTHVCASRISNVCKGSEMSQKKKHAS